MKIRTRSIACILALCGLLVGLAPQAALAQGTAVVSFNPSSTTVAVGSTVNVTVRVDGVSNLRGVEVHITFDPALLEIVDTDSTRAGVQIALGPFLSPDYPVQNDADLTAGHLDFAYSQLPPSVPVSGSGVLATITFRGRAAGTSALSFTSVILADAAAAPIPSTTQNGQLTVTSGETTPTPATPTSTPPPPTPTTGTVLTLSPQSAAVALGGTTTVKLRVTGASNLYGVEVHLTHGSGIDVTALSPGPCVASVVAQNSVADNRVDYAASLQVPASPVNGDCDLATLTIRGLAAGTHSLQFTGAILSNSSGQPLTVTTINGTVVVGGPTATPSPGCSNILGYHVVQPGETLYAIGRAYGVRPDGIAACNYIVNPSRLYAGTRLAIPNIPWWPIPPGPVARRQFGSGTSTCRYYHTVQWGETLFRISIRYGVSMWAIAQANTIYNLNYIRAGQVLCIP